MRRLMLRKLEEGIARVLMIAALAAALGCPLSIIATVLVKGLPAIDWQTLTQAPQGGYYTGAEGGILNAILGSLLLGIASTAAAFLIGVPISLALQVYAGRSRLASVVRLALDVLWGVPSIVYGAFGFSLMLFLGLRASLIAGVLALTMVELPILCRAVDEVLRTAPFELAESAYALGATRWEVGWKILLRHALPGVISAALLAFGRGLGDAASVLLTAGYTDSLPTSPLRPAASLPLAVFFQLGTPFPKVQQRAYAAALVLTALVLLASVLSRFAFRSLSDSTAG
jgi:phosphate transport system permease protein